LILGFSLNEKPMRSQALPFFMTLATPLRRAVLFCCSGVTKYSLPHYRVTGAGEKKYFLSPGGNISSPHAISCAPSQNTFAPEIKSPP